MSTKAPVFFISHGGPTLLEDTEKPGMFYDWFGSYLKNYAPKAIVIISAHWQPQEEKKILVDSSKKPKLIYDFYGFPQRFYDVTWDQQGSPELARRVVGLLHKAGLGASEIEYGHDHGIWTPMKRAMNSCADIPIVGVSTYHDDALAPHVAVGEALASLRDENIIIIGTGTAVHNLTNWRTYGDKPSPSYVREFDKVMESCATEFTGDERKEKAISFDKLDYYRDCHPTAEHLVPFHVAVGAAGQDKGVKLMEDFYARLSWGSYGFGLPEDTVLPKL
ncbi:aromatic ring-opening dioxygenase LigB subunit [Sporodiniella umbellata]|nr:aromatic ring-opening dioxygenase LigB subunit [Sporodiniella umbellata]